MENTDFSINSFSRILGSESCNETGYTEASGICTLVTGLDAHGKPVQAVFDAVDLLSIASGQKAFLVFR